MDLKRCSYLPTLISIFLHFGICAQANVTEVIVGETFSVDCFNGGTGETVEWKHNSNTFYQPQRYFQGHDTKVYHVSKESGTLTKRNATPTDAGQYHCQALDDNDLFSVTSVIVLDTDPICESNVKLDEVIGSNSCGITLDEIRLTCSVKYHGNHSLSLKWRRKGEENETLESNCTADGDNWLKCVVKLKGEMKINGTSYICQTATSPTKQHNCSTDEIKILYSTEASIKSVVTNKTIVNTGDRVTCKANSSSQFCSYRWKLFDYYYKSNEIDEHQYESNSTNLTAKLFGWHMCEANCTMRDKSCLFSAKYIYVSSSTDNDINGSHQLQNGSFLPSLSRPQSTIVIVLVTAFLTTLTILVIGYIYKTMSCQSKRKPESANAIPVSSLSGNNLLESGV